MITVKALKRLWYKAGEKYVPKGEEFAIKDNEIESLEALGLVERKPAPKPKTQPAKAPKARKAIDNGNS